MEKLEVLIFTVQSTQISCQSQSPNIGKTSAKRKRLSLCLPREESALLRLLTGVLFCENKETPLNNTNLPNGQSRALKLKASVSGSFFFLSSITHFKGRNSSF